MFEGLARQYQPQQEAAAAAGVGSLESIQQPHLADAGAIEQSATDAVMKNIGADKKRPGKYAQFRTLVFISNGMPEKTLRALFAQAAGDKEIGFVLRGFLSTNLYQEMRRFAAMMPKDDKAAIVFVDPMLFDAYRVDKVPYTLHKAKNGKWYGLWGEIAVDGAREIIEAGRGGRDKPPVGPVHDIKEQDFQEVLRARFEKYDWATARNRAIGRASDIHVERNIPVAAKDRVRFVDITTPVTQNIQGERGEVLMPAGTLVNPLNVVSLDHRYAVFDPTDKRQVEIVRRWGKSKGLPVTFIATEWANDLSRKFSDGPLFLLDPLMEKRIKIERVPCLVEQDGQLIKITEAGVAPSTTPP